MSLVKIKTMEQRRRRRSGGFRIVVLALLGCVMLAYFTVTSSLFFRIVVLPRVSDKLDADVTVSHARVSPFRQLVLTDLVIKPRGQDALLSAEAVRVRYSVLALLRKQLVIDELALTGPTLTVVRDKQGENNLHQFLQRLERLKPETTNAPPSQMELEQLSIVGGKVRFTQEKIGGQSEDLELHSLTLDASGLKAAQTGKIEFVGTLLAETLVTGSNKLAMVQGKLAGQFEFEFSTNLTLATLTGDASFDTEVASGNRHAWDGLGLKLHWDASPARLQELVLRCRVSGQDAGELKLVGPFDISRQEGNLHLEANSLDRRFLNVFGGSSGIDFGTTEINFNSDFEVSQEGRLVTAGGRLDVARLQLIRGGASSPTMDLRCDYAVNSDGVAGRTTVPFLNVSGTQDARLFLQGSLNSPLVINRNPGTNSGTESVLTLKVIDWQLGDWAEFLGGPELTGTMNSELKLVSSQSGSQLSLELDGALDPFHWHNEITRSAQVRVKWQGRAAAKELKVFQLDELRFETFLRNESAISATFTGNINIPGRTSEAQLAGVGSVPLLAELLGKPEVTMTAGNTQFRGHYNQDLAGNAFTGLFMLADVSGQIGDVSLDHFSSQFDFDILQNEYGFNLRRASGAVFGSGLSGGRIEAAASFMHDQRIAPSQAVLRVMDLNEIALRPLGVVLFGHCNLQTATASMNATLRFPTNGLVTLLGDAQIGNLVVNRPGVGVNRIPLAANLGWSGSLSNRALEIQKCRLSLTPSSRAPTNAVALAGVVKFPNPFDVGGQLRLEADALDLTGYYDLVAHDLTLVEPAPSCHPLLTQLPFKDFSVSLDFGQLYLRELVLRDVKAEFQAEPNKWAFENTSLTLNGAPVTIGIGATLDHSGSVYDLNLSASSVPAAPVVNTFHPKLHGSIAGNFTLNTKLNGIGGPGPSLSNLNGSIEFTATNLNLAIRKSQFPPVNAALNGVAGLPSYLAMIPGREDLSAGQKWSEEIARGRIDRFSFQGAAQNGKMTIQDAQLDTTGIRLSAAGEIKLARSWSQCDIRLPIDVSLKRAYAQASGIFPVSLPNQSAYISVPDFLVVTGTLGHPKNEILLTKLGGTTTKSLGKIIATGVGRPVPTPLMLSGNDQGSSGANEPVTEPSRKAGGILSWLWGAN